MRNKEVYLNSAYRVVFQGQLCSPEWEERGPAIAYLDALLRGTRRPEFVKEKSRD